MTNEENHETQADSSLLTDADLEGISGGVMITEDGVSCTGIRLIPPRHPYLPELHTVRF
jgi:hypothetical protein